MRNPFKRNKEPVTPKIKPDYRVYTYGGSWGRHVSIFDKYKGPGTPRIRRVTGHWTPVPQNGDILEMEMESNRITLWVFYNLEYPGDPRDMFFADIFALGYKDEYNLPKSTYKSTWEFA